MKNFLRIIAILFLLIIGIWLVASGVLFGNNQRNSENTTSEQNESVSEEVDFSNEVDAQEDSIETLINPNPEDEGIIILGGDGIPNN